ncbi:MAG TPA: hypothetical protein VGQ76_22050 [Thermoanaerobaculia bacterium]|jgi:hypothetical protein|nr:hypothetical protein [Thermoanaerobaculia bacterium]
MNKPPALEALTPPRRNGCEKLHRGREALSLTVSDFWQWSMSDLVSNLARGRFAEFIVAHALGINVKVGVRNEWDPVDLTTSDGIKVEVKSSAYLQSWHQKQRSTVAWRLTPTRAWNSATGEYATQSRLQADVYVLALLAHEEKESLDPLDLDQWCFFVLPRHVAAAQDRTLTFAAVEKLVGPPVTFEELASKVQQVRP